MTCMTDAQLAQLALAQETSDKVRNFATRLVQDCERNLLEIARIATRKNLPVPRALDQEHETILQRMRGKRGPDFHSAVRHLSLLESDVALLVRVEMPVIGRDGKISGVLCRNLPLTSASRSTPLTQD